MRLPFNFNNSDLDQEARIKLSYTSPEHHQNIEISMDGDEVSVETLLDAFQRFLGALGICVPENVVLTFVELEEEGDSKEIKFDLNDEKEDDEDDEEEDK